MIMRDRLGPGPERAHLNEAAHATPPGRAHEILCSFGMNLLEGLLADFADDSDQVDNRIDAIHRSSQRLRAGDISLMKFGGGPFSKFLGCRFVACQDPRLMTGSVDLCDDFPPHETGRSGD